VISFNANKESRCLTFPECPFLGFHPAMKQKRDRLKNEDFIDSCWALSIWMGRFSGGKPNGMVSNGNVSENLENFFCRKFVPLFHLEENLHRFFNTSQKRSLSYSILSFSELPVPAQGPAC